MSNRVHIIPCNSDPDCSLHAGRQCDSCVAAGSNTCFPFDRLANVHYDDPEQPVWMECADCIAEGGDELQRCHDCGDYYHCDLEAMAGSICLACEERRIDEDATEPAERMVYA